MSGQPNGTKAWPTSLNLDNSKGIPKFQSSPGSAEVIIKLHYRSTAFSALPLPSARPLTNVEGTQLKFLHTNLYVLEATCETQYTLKF